MGGAVWVQGEKERGISKDVSVDSLGSPEGTYKHRGTEGCACCCEDEQMWRCGLYDFNGAPE